MLCLPTTTCGCVARGMLGMVSPADDAVATWGCANTGIKVTKFGRRGKPHARFVFLHGDSIRWADKEGGKPHKRHRA